MDEAVFTPDERTFREHLRRTSFVSGQAAGRWRIVSIAWPHALIAVTAAQRATGPTEFHLRLDLTGYPLNAPTATPWDVEHGVPLPAERRPKGATVAHVFRTDWEGGRALYAPYDRVALEGHRDWKVKHPLFTWNDSRDISFFLEQVYAVLNSDDYQGI